MKNILIATCLASLALLVNPAFSACPPNCGPPAGAILDLDGTPITHSYTQYSINFTATTTTTNIRFAFRDDPAGLNLDDVSVTTGAGPNLILNPGFELGIIMQSAPVDWTYQQLTGGGGNGAVDSTNTPHTGTLVYADGTVGSYDAITQAITTVPGSLYTLTFWLSETSTQSTYHRLATVDGNDTGLDLLVYADPVGSSGVAAVSMPTLSQWMLAVLACLLLVVAVVTVRRQRG